MFPAPGIVLWCNTSTPPNPSGFHGRSNAQSFRTIKELAYAGL